MFTVLKALALINTVEHLSGDFSAQARDSSAGTSRRTRYMRANDWLHLFPFSIKCMGEVIKNVEWPAVQ